MRLRGWGRGRLWWIPSASIHGLVVDGGVGDTEREGDGRVELDMREMVPDPSVYISPFHPPAPPLLPRPTSPTIRPIRNTLPSPTLDPVEQRSSTSSSATSEHACSTTLPSPPTRTTNRSNRDADRRAHALSSLEIRSNRHRRFYARKPLLRPSAEPSPAVARACSNSTSATLPPRSPPSTADLTSSSCSSIRGGLRRICGSHEDRRRGR